MSVALGSAASAMDRVRWRGGLGFRRAVMHEERDDLRIVRGLLERVQHRNRSRRLFARVSARRMRTRVGYGPSQSNRYGV